MSSAAPKSEAEEDKISLLSAELDEVPVDDEVTRTGLSVKPDERASEKSSHDGQQYLEAPRFGPIRPLSPDTLSNLSADEYEPGRPNLGRRVGSYRQPSRSPAPPRTWRGKLQASWIRNKGLFYMLLAQVFGTLMNVTTRLLEVEGNKGKGLHPFQILFARMGITFVLASGYMWYRKTPYFPLGMPEVRWLLVARGMGGFFGVFGMYYSLLYLPLADATVITFLAPPLACWVCSILIKEPFTRIEKIGALVSFIGVIFIARPTTFFSGSASAPPASGNSDMTPATNGTATAPDASSYENVTPTQRLAAVGIALIGVLGAVCAYTTIRWVGKRAHPLISVNYFAAWCTFVSLVMQFALPGVGFLLPADLKEWGYLIFLGTCGFVMQFLLAAGLSYEKSSRATNMTYTQMLFALSFDKLIFGTTPGVMSIIGSSLILGSAIFVALQRDVTPAKESNEGSSMNRDEERGLMGAIDGQETERGRMPVQEVHMRTLR
ncbi:hypothetical protein M8818_002232 [Zalaria obscura]|uniref:Uncharacterized protein n=1 Tax=Zalaria obscura TaxID=2024903 RepID=A0ACC3SIW3_9PEZI